MKDETGLYYYPRPGDTRERVYVREVNGEIQFRLWLADKPEIFEEHGWLPYPVIEQAAALYKNERNPNLNHLCLYDIQVARALIRAEEKARAKTCGEKKTEGE